MDTAVDIYRSRSSSETTIIGRQDPVVYPGNYDGQPHALSRSQLRNYQRNGFILLKGLFPETEAASLLEEVQRMAAQPEIAAREEAIAEPGSDEVRSVFSVHTLNQRMSELARDARLVNVARQILGSDVYIHQSRVNLKSGFFGKDFYWHSDFETWHVEDGMPRMRAVSCVVLLTENNEFNGPLMLMPGSHKHFISCVGETPADHYKLSLRKQEYGVADSVALRFLFERGGLRSMKGPAGSVVFFDCNTMHGSNSNISPYPRSNVFMVYNSVHNRLDSPAGQLAPRPEFIATRDTAQTIVPMEPPVEVGA
jgi:ectoine hydroxylase